MDRVVLPSMLKPPVLSGGNTIVLLCVSPIIIVFLLFLLSGLYNLYLHPLSKVPGPKLYGFTAVPHLYHLIKGDWHVTLKELHDQYGPVVRFCPISVSFNSPEAFKHIYGHKSAGEKPYEKDEMFFARVRSIENISFTSSVGHRRHRRLISHAFSAKALSSQEHILKQYCDSFVSNLEKYSKEQGGTVDIVRWFNFVTFDLIGDLAFGESFGCMDQGGYHPWIHVVFSSVKFFIYRYVLCRLNLERIVSMLLPTRLKKGAEEHHAFAREISMRRMEAGVKERPDFMSYILRYNDHRGLTAEEIFENANFLVAAGSETTASLLSGIVFYLMQQPEMYDKLVKEIRGAFNSQEEITLDGVSKLEYMLAVLQEGLRICPPIPAELPRRIPEGGDVISGYWLPGNTRVGVAHWAAFMSSSNFRDPESFVPERWMNDPRYADDKKDVHNPFSLGPRNCVGHNLANAEMRLLLAYLLWNFDLESASQNYEKWADQKVYAAWQKQDLDVRLVKAARR
ncbi:unnamed protein product [Clonostachys rosea]|uniref:Cytochrome P450 n=1 Tax=Bionectria ochroleuca TaxID=29856 RepID=A0ABY6UZY2_BIOOC|nr:unnamed protein product [Clonostachys rosea]